MKSRIILVIAAIGLASLGWFFFGERPAVFESESRDEVVVAVESEPLSCDPVAMLEVGSATLGNAIHSPLWRMKPDGSLDFILAESLDFPIGGTRATITLRQGVYFSDGTPITGDDVVASLLRFKNSGNPLAAVLDRVETISSSAPGKVFIELSEPDETLPAALAHLQAAILKKASFSQAKEPLDRQIVGAGPWMLEHLEPGVSYSCRPNPGFPRQQPFANLVFAVKKDSQAPLREFRQKRLDIVRLRGQMAGEVAVFKEGSAKLREGFERALLRQASASHLDTLILNWMAPSLQGVKGLERRKWLAWIRHAVENSPITHTGGAEPTGTFPPTVAPVLPWPYINEASEWAPGSPIEVLASADPSSRFLAAAISNALRDAGIPVTTRYMDIAQLIPAVLKGDFTFVVMGFDMPITGVVPWRIFWVAGPFSGFGQELSDYAQHEAPCRVGSLTERHDATIEFAKWHQATQDTWAPIISRPTQVLCSPRAKNFRIDAAGTPIWDFSIP